MAKPQAKKKAVAPAHKPASKAVAGAKKAVKAVKKVAKKAVAKAKPAPKPAKKATKKPAPKPLKKVAPKAAQKKAPAKAVAKKPIPKKAAPAPKKAVPAPKKPVAKKVAAKVTKSAAKATKAVAKVAKPVAKAVKKAVKALAPVVNKKAAKPEPVKAPKAAAKPEKAPKGHKVEVAAKPKAAPAAAPAAPAPKAAAPAPAPAEKEKRTRRPRPRILSNGTPVAAWLTPGEKPRPSSFIPAPPRAEAPSLVAAPPASSDRLIRPEDVSSVAVRTVPVRVDIEQGNGRSFLSVSPDEVTLRTGEGIEWDFRYLGGADVMADEVIIEFETAGPFSSNKFRSRKPGPARPHRQLSGPAEKSSAGQRVRYTIKVMTPFMTEFAVARPWVIVQD